MEKSLSPVERDILAGLLLLGDSIPLSVAELTDRHPKSVSRSVSELEEAGLVVEKHRAVYALTPSGYRRARAEIRRRAENK